MVSAKYEQWQYVKHHILDMAKAIQLFMDYVKKKPLGEADGIVLSVVEGNNVALKLYESFGFKVIGEDKYGHIAMRH